MNVRQYLDATHSCYKFTGDEFDLPRIEKKNLSMVDFMEQRIFYALRGNKGDRPKFKRQAIGPGGP